MAGVSVDYYTRLERGDAAGASPSVIDGIARALRLDDAERTHLVDLLREPRAAVSPPRRRPPARVQPSVQRVLDSMSTAPAFVSDSRLDLLATNALCAALYSGIEPQAGSSVNLARYTFLDPGAARFYAEWDAVADMTVALLRASAGHDPFDRDLTDLVGELATRSEAFRTRWAAHDVQRHTSGVKRMRHPEVGDLELGFDSMALAADPDLTITVYTAAPGSRTEEALRLLASWHAAERDPSATPDRRASRPR